MVRIEKKLPPPPARAKYPWDTIKVGESFFVESQSMRQHLYTMAGRKGIRVRTAREGSGIRVWRIK